MGAVKLRVCFNGYYSEDYAMAVAIGWTVESVWIPALEPDYEGDDVIFKLIEEDDQHLQVITPFAVSCAVDAGMRSFDALIGSERVQVQLCPLEAARSMVRKWTYDRP